MARASSTDPDAHVMRNGEGGTVPSYNVQLLTDATHGLVVNVDATTDATDYRQMQPAQPLAANHLIEAAKLAPRWNPQLAARHARELEYGHRNRATPAVARKLVAYLLAVDKSRQPFQMRAPSEGPTQKAA